jgi:hypothetical protein
MRVIDNPHKNLYFCEGDKKLSQNIILVPPKLDQSYLAIVLL